jgi:hypothetical protein
VNFDPLNPHGRRGVERDPNPLPPNSFDGDDNIVADPEFLARFAAKNQHAMPRFLTGTADLILLGGGLLESNGGRLMKRAQKGAILGEMG